MRLALAVGGATGGGSFPPFPSPPPSVAIAFMREGTALWQWPIDLLYGLRSSSVFFFLFLLFPFVVTLFWVVLSPFGGALGFLSITVVVRFSITCGLAFFSLLSFLSSSLTYHTHTHPDRQTDRHTRGFH